MINPSLAIYGVGRSTASTPTYSHGLVGGEPFSTESTIEPDSVSCGVRANVDAYKTEISVASDIETRAYADVCGLYFLAALGDVTTTTESTHKKHVFSLGDSLPALNVWSQIDNGSVRKIEGAKMDTLELSFEGNNPLTLGVTLAGLVGTYGSTTWGGSDVSCFDGYFTCVGSTLKLSANSSTPASLGNNVVTAGSLSISNNVEAKYGVGTLTPKAIANGKCVCSGSLTINPDSEDIIRTIETGTTSGTSLIGSVVYGSFEWTFAHTKESAFSLKVEADHVPFKVSAMSVDPEGNALEIELSWDDCLVTSATDSPVTITLINDVASY